MSLVSEMDAVDEDPVVLLDGFAEDQIHVQKLGTTTSETWAVGRKYCRYGFRWNHLISLRVLSPSMT